MTCSTRYQTFWCEKNSENNWSYVWFIVWECVNLLITTENLWRNICHWWIWVWVLQFFLLVCLFFCLSVFLSDWVLRVVVLEFLNVSVSVCLCLWEWNHNKISEDNENVRHHQYKWTASISNGSIIPFLKFLLLLLFSFSFFTKTHIEFMNKNRFIEMASFFVSIKRWMNKNVWWHSEVAIKSELKDSEWMRLYW